MALANFIRGFLGRGRRQHRRHGHPSICVRYHGRRMRVEDWPLSGCLLPAPEPTLGPPLRVGGTFEGRIRSSSLGNSGEFLAEVVRITEDGAMGLRWLELDSHVFLVHSGHNIK